MISKVSISKIEYKVENCLRLKFAYNAITGNAINKLAISEWSETRNSCLMPFIKDFVKALSEIFIKIEFEDEASKIMALCKENDTKDEVPIWEDVDYLYIKVNTYARGRY